MIGVLITYLTTQPFVCTRTIQRYVELIGQ